MHSQRLLPVLLFVLAPTAGPARAQGFLTATSTHFWRMHRPENSDADPDWMRPPSGSEPSGRYGARNALEAYWLLGSSEADADLESERLGRKLLLSLPLAGRGNLLPLLLEPTGNLALTLTERIFLGTRRHAARINPPPGCVAIDTHVHTCYSPDSV